ncbi:ATP-dependent Clp protease proteolytic subunit like [Quillaja saponaria]|uniref:ATP-dependent Clp protease proteolytic subunit like n=1 Tax=Quillaja saponaria TaxID=32244 RepID=A0AAD7PCS2_QUISA|nr:ATP-dependent Clp protease proteolytic subunit like [Quillaja saponaria]
MANMLSEITEEKDEEAPCFINTEAQKERIREIIRYQKSLYWSSSSSMSSAAASCSSFSSSRKSSSLLELMKRGDTSLRRLFDMEHTSLLNHFECYSGSPIIKTIPLWGSDTEHEFHDPWASIKKIRSISGSGTDRQIELGSESSFKDVDYGFQNRNVYASKHRLTRKRSFRRLPGFGLWRCRGRGFRLRLRLRRLRFMICGRKLR